MADVTEVIHKITYEVNNDALNSATAAIQAQLQELNKMNKMLDIYGVQLSKISSTESKQIENLSRRIDALNRDIIRKAGETEGALKQVFNGALKGLNIENNLKDAVGKYVGGISAKFKELQKSSSELQSVTKGMWTSVSTGAATGTAKAGSALKNFGKSLTSVTGLIDIGVVAVVSLADELLNMDNPLGLITGKMEALNEINRMAAGDIAQVTTDITIMKERFLDANASVETKIEVMNELNDKYGSTIGDLKDLNQTEEFFVNKSEDFIEAMKLRAQSQAAYNLLVNEQQKLLEAQANKPEENIGAWQKVWIGVKSYFEGGVMPSMAASYSRNLSAANEAVLKDAEKKLDEVSSHVIENVKQTKQKLDEINARNNFNSNNEDPEKTIDTKPNRNSTVDRKVAKEGPRGEEPKLEIPAPTEEEAEAAAQEIANVIISALKMALKEGLEKIEYDELQSFIRLEEQYKEGVIVFEDYEKEKVRIHDKAVQDRLAAEKESYGEISEVRDADAEEVKEADMLSMQAYLQTLQAANKKKKKKGNDGEGNDEDEDEKDKKQRSLTEAQKENIKKGIDAYQQLAQAAADAYNKILQAQINALEQEISIREKRVEEAKKLAEKGNVDALRIEEERLRKAQQQKERYARQQQAVNAALTVSNAIVAVATAAAAGGGFGSIATIAALIAALAAGYAAVTSMSSDSTQAFADGVVDYKGKGGPRDDKNWVRISSGESVITAEGTQRNRALLEAINKGAALHMIDPTLPLLMPMLKQPATITGNTYATAGDMNKLEQKLDEVVDAIEGNKMKQNIFFNEQGVGIMTERAIARERRRWK